MDEIDIGEELNTTDLGPIFPLSRVKKIMKTDKDVHMCSADAVLFTAMAAVLFMMIVRIHCMCRSDFSNTSVRTCVERLKKTRGKR